MSAIDEIRKNLGTPAPQPLNSDINRKGTTQPDTVPKGSAVDSIRASLAGSGAMPAPTTPTPEKKGVFATYSDQVNRKIASFDAGVIQSAGQLLRSFQWAGDRLVGDRIVKKQADQIQASELKAQDDMFQLYLQAKNSGDTKRASDLLGKYQKMVETMTPYNPVADTTDSVFYKAQDKTKAWADTLKASAGITPENSKFSDRLFEGAGSSATYFIPSIGVFKGASVIAKVSPKIAMLFAGSAGGALEAMAEAGSTFDEWKAKGDMQRANEESTKVFFANAILLAVTNRFGVFNPEKLGVLKRALLSAPVEGLQEAVQQMIQNQATDKPIMEGVVESGLIGGIVGSVMGGATDIMTSPTSAVIPPVTEAVKEPITQATNTTAQAIANAIKEVESGGDYNAKGGSGENGAYQFMPATWSQWAKTWLGNANAPMTKENQDLVAERQIQSWIDKGYTPRQIALMWNGGTPKEKKGVNSFGVAYDSGAYADKVLGALGGAPTESPAISALREKLGVTKAIDLQKETEGTSTTQPEPLPSPTVEVPKTPNFATPEPIGEGKGSDTDVRLPEKPEAEISPAKQEEADTDWNDNFAGRIEELDTRLSELRTQIKEAKGDEKVALTNEKQTLEAKSAEIEQEFLNKWKPTPEPEIFTAEGKLNIDKKGSTEMTKSQLRRAGFGVEAMGYGEYADVETIGGKPAIAFRFADEGPNTIMGISVQKDFRRKGIAEQFLRETAQDGKIYVQTPNEDMLRILNRIGEVSKPDSEDIVTVTVGEKKTSAPLEKKEAPAEAKLDDTKKKPKNKEKADLKNKEKLGDKKDLRLELQDKPEAKENQVMTEVQGKEVPRYGIDRKFGSNSLVAFEKKPLLTKTDLKTILKYTPEFRNNPVLTVEEYVVDGKNRAVLAFRGKDASFEIQANALGLVEENLKTGDQVKVSAETLSRTGKEFRVVSYNASGSGSSYASVGRYRDDTEVFLRNPDEIKAIQFPELVALASELSGNVPFLRKYQKANGMFYGKGGGEIGLNPELFKRENLRQLQATLAHEIGHLVDYLPTQTLKRGNLIGRLNTLNDFRKEFYKPAGTTRSDAELRTQMYELSKYWRPYDEKTAKPSFIAYRKSAPEIYADFISALFNEPRTVSSIAPTAYNMFFEQLDTKPNVKQAYFELQDLLRNGDLTATRRSATKQMFKLTEAESKERQIQNQIEQEQRERSVWFKFKTENVDITEVVKEDVKKAEAEGKVINPDNNPTYYLEERNYIGGKIKSEVDTKFNTIYQELQKDGLTWEDLGELMMYERILKGDRQEVANPLGYQPDFVEGLMEVYEVYEDVGTVKADKEAHAKSSSDMKTTLGEARYAKLQLLAKEYRENLKGFFEQGREEGIYSEELAQMFKDNAFYVPFKGAKYSGVTRTTFGVKQMKGTLGNIENPANTGIEKAVSIIRAIERNKVTRKTIEFYQQNFPEEVTEASLDSNGRPIQPREKNLGLVTYMQDGKVKGFYVDSYIAQAIQKVPSGPLNIGVSVLRFWNSKLFRPLFITFNLGFQTFNLIRDMKRFWKNVPDMTILKTMRLYSQSVRASKIRAFGLPTVPSQADLEAYDLINRLENEQVLSITYNDIIKGESIEDAQIDRILREVGVREVENTKLGELGERIGLTKETPIIKQAFQIMDFIENLGNMIESLPKVAGVKELEGKMQPREMRSFVRKYVGSPDFLAGGRDKKNINEVFLFANAIFQGIRSDYEIATQPKSRGAYWLKTALSELGPKALMIMAGAGLFGEYLKELFGKISEYDKTNYTTIPLGIDENGKAVYFRIPSDETGRLIGGTFWKLASAVSNPEQLAEYTTYTDIVSYAGGQVPSVTPVVTTGFNLMQFLAGENPYDFFRQRPLLTDDQQEAGGMERTKPFLAYMFQNMGGNIFVKLYTNETVPKNPSLSEKIASLPLVGNVAGRFIRTSNYGEVEAIREVSGEIRQEKAREGLVNRRVVFDYVEQAQDKSDAEVRQLKKQMIQDIYGGFPKTPEERTQARNLEKRFDTLRIRGTADARVDALVVAQSNAEKVALLREYEKTMSPEQYAELRRFIIQNRVVSSAVFQELNRVGNNSEVE